MEEDNVLRAYEKMSKNNKDIKFLVNIGAIVAPLEIGGAILSAFYGNFGEAAAVGSVGLIIGYFTYKLHKKTKESDEKIKSLENKVK